jgi:hypothetical protein
MSRHPRLAFFVNWLSRAAVFAASSAATIYAARAAAEPAPAAQEPTQEPSAAGAESLPRFHVGTSLFTLVSLVPSETNPHFVQLNAGYRVTQRDVLSVEAITWRYHEPLGVPYGPSKGAPEEAYPGHVTEAGVGLAYQRMIWRGFYGSLSAIPFWRRFVDEAGEGQGNGFQLFMTLRLGWHIPVWGGLFIEPSIAMTMWPVSTGAPEGFATLDSRWPSYFLFEPGLHAGFRF